MFITSSPSEKKMAGFNWTRWLEDSTKDTWGWNALPDGGIEKLAENYDNATNRMTILWTGGTPGTVYTVKGYVEAVDGRREYEEFEVLVKPD